MFGGADPKIVNQVPSDIEIRGNYFLKPQAWRGSALVVKNLFELKIARRTLVEGNVFEYTWLAGQDYAINIKSVNQDGAAPWSVTEDLTFRYNIVRHAPSAIKFCAISCDGFPTVQGGRYLIQNNLFDDINSVAWGGSGNFLQTSGSVPDLVVNHNTVIHNGSAYNTGGGSSTGFVFTDNIVQRGPFGFKGPGLGEGNPTLNAIFPGFTFAKNIIVGGSASSPLNTSYAAHAFGKSIVSGVSGASARSYPANNFFPISFDQIGFESLSGGDYRLAGESPYRGAGTDGKDIGADIAAVNAATACSVSGQCKLPSLANKAGTVRRN